MTVNETQQLVDAVRLILQDEHDCDEFYCGYQQCTEKRRQWAVLEQALFDYELIQDARAKD